jgi:hypothetical protein
VTTYQGDTPSFHERATSAQYVRFGSSTTFTVEPGDRIDGLALAVRRPEATVSGAISAVGFAEHEQIGIYGGAQVYERLDDMWLPLPGAHPQVGAERAVSNQISLPSGQYTVGLDATYSTLDDPSRVRGEWWDSASDRASATILDLQPGDVRTDVSGVLRNGDAADPLPKPIYRFWSREFGGHFYTASSAERDRVIAQWPSIWNYEGARFDAFTTPARGTVPLYRFWSVAYRGHFYTTDPVERARVSALWSDVWQDEGVAYYVYPPTSTIADTVPVARFWSPILSHHFYTADRTERDDVLRRWPDVWTFEQDEFRVPSGDVTR